MAEKSTIQFEKESQIPKFDGKLIVDEYQAIERILVRLDTIYAAYIDSESEPTAVWCSILEDEGYQVLEQLREVQNSFGRKSTVLEYIEALEKKYGYKLQPV